MKPIDLVETSKHPVETSDPTVANVRSVSSPPRSSRPGEQPSTPVVSVPYSSGGNPQHDLCYLLVELLLIIDRPLMRAHPQFMFLPQV